MGESRQELLTWLNQLLSLNLTKVEQCGTGAPLCQVYDSIFLDVPMTRVKFNVNSEYMYIQNFKVLQNTFAKHKIDHPVPVESLVKCKMQDNLEFLQFTKRFWDQNFPGIEYDPVARRKASGAPTGGGVGGGASASLRTSTSSKPASTPAARRPITSNSAAARAPRAGSAAGGSVAQTAALKQENDQLKETVEGLERERDFYFNKLRDIELLMQEVVENNPALEQEENGLVPRCQAILYSTEEGFEIPEAEEGGVVAGDAVAEEETF
ncbi:MAG: hypothetical protein Q9162_002711 [Coniocarpon cinnabarinum]